MNSYQINQTSRTTSTLVLAGILVGQLATAYKDTNSVDGVKERLVAAPYLTNAAPSSFDQIRNIFGGVVEPGPDPFVESVSTFYAKLLASQENLATEFSRVLHDNLWDLYER